MIAGLCAPSLADACSGGKKGWMNIAHGPADMLRLAAA